tara:strand:- start:2310 stop:3230 length:921 start_codon:yes stop_codon:yes gene_type:complete
MLNLLKKFKSGFAKTSRKLFGSLGNLFGNQKLDPQAIETIEEALYGADFGVETTTEIVEEIQTAYKANKELRGQEAAQIGSSVLKRVLEGAQGALELEQNEPTVICLIGINGSGKTTTTAKLGHFFKEQSKSVLLGACDTFRAAANEQVKTWASRLGLDIVCSQHGADAASVAFDTYQSALSRKHDVVILDTAGRLHTKTNLMEELRKIRKVLKKQNERAPHHRWLVLDGSIGSNSIEQARLFHKEFGLTGLIISKLDGTSRGGALVGIYRELKLPIYFIGLGEAAEDLQPFSVDSYVEAIFNADA